MKDTPRTDKKIFEHPSGYEVVISELAYQLVLELNAARAEIERLDTAGIHSCHKDCQRPNCVLRRELKAVTEQRDRLAEALEQWQPIETAPKDRSFILSAHPEHGYLITRWLGAREMWDGWAIEPTHWMSLPKLTTP